MSSMLHELARTVLLIAEFTFVLIVLLFVGLAAIPGRVRGRKHRLIGHRRNSLL